MTDSPSATEGHHAWERWRTEGAVTCSCRYCLWSLEGCRNPGLAASCEWEAAKETAAYAITAVRRATVP